MAERILVVDDEPDLLELVRVNLRQAGYEVETSETGRDALDLLRRSPPDLVVLDLMLPDVTGTEICRRMRSDIDLSEIPIIMLTAKADEVDRVVGLELGADDYVTKPFSPRELTLRVRAVLRRRKPAAAPSEALAHGTLRMLSEHAGDRWWWALVAGIVIAAPIVEETLHRGLIQTALVRATASKCFSGSATRSS